MPSRIRRPPRDTGTGPGLAIGRWELGYCRDVPSGTKDFPRAATFINPEFKPVEKEIKTQRLP